MSAGCAWPLCPWEREHGRASFVAQSNGGVAGVSGYLCLTPGVGAALGRKKGKTCARGPILEWIAPSAKGATRTRGWFFILILLFVASFYLCVWVRGRVCFSSRLHHCLERLWGVKGSSILHFYFDFCHILYHIFFLLNMYG
jgi:hypothetical protein